MYVTIVLHLKSWLYLSRFPMAITSLSRSLPILSESFKFSRFDIWLGGVLNRCLSIVQRWFPSQRPKLVRYPRLHSYICKRSRATKKFWLTFTFCARTLYICKMKWSFDTSVLNINTMKGISVKIEVFCK